MYFRKLNIFKTFILLYILLSSITLTIICLIFKNLQYILVFLLFSVLFFLIMIILIICIRRSILDFTNNVEDVLDNMIYEKENIDFYIYNEDITGKLDLKLKQIYEIMQDKTQKAVKDKKMIEALISDISHQVKTPISNVKMYNSILLENELTDEKRKEFLNLAGISINRLDFLMQSMIKMSRLESDIIQLNIEKLPIYDTIAAALGGIVLKAESKNINILVECEQDILIFHDKKWTAEALFNILDNAIKYTKDNGKIDIIVQKQEFYLSIKIEDNGIGIPENEQALIFKRFYRCKSNQNEEGVGIGLYLARNIISRQDGYIQVKSEVGKGTTFFVFLNLSKL